MPTVRYRGSPMTLANMRQQGVRSLWVARLFPCQWEASTPIRSAIDTSSTNDSPELSPSLCYVYLDGAFRDAKLISNLSVQFSPRYQFEDLLFARCQSGDARP